MTKHSGHGALDLRRHPYRGILAEIAREDGVERQAVQKRAKRGDPDTLARIARKVRERDAKLADYTRLKEGE
ncbi:MAG: hypothetical protein JST22_06960 [Bacteroidetes bacterium]|nr:hypothetical protein [Bacteroidota bacterium]HVZ40530.1 hypothetical protein [Candidatus Kapabacteria bacterium]